MLTGADSPVASSSPHPESSHLIFSLFLSPWIMNKIIIVCSEKFLLHFPMLMIILFKYIDWKIYSVIWMPMISPNMCGENHNIVSSYCFFFIIRNAVAVSVQRLKIVWNVQLDNPRTCEYDLYSVKIDFDSVCMSDHCFLINKCARMWMCEHVSKPLCMCTLHVWENAG